MAPRLTAEPTKVVSSESESEEFRIFRSCIATGVAMGGQRVTKSATPRSFYRLIACMKCNKRFSTGNEIEEHMKGHTENVKNTGGLNFLEDISYTDILKTDIVIKVICKSNPNM